MNKTVTKYRVVDSQNKVVAISSKLSGAEVVKRKLDAKERRETGDAGHRLEAIELTKGKPSVIRWLNDKEKTALIIFRAAATNRLQVWSLFGRGYLHYRKNGDILYPTPELHRFIIVTCELYHLRKRVAELEEEQKAIRPNRRSQP